MSERPRIRSQIRAGQVDGLGMKRKRPLSITILAIIVCISGFVFVSAAATFSAGFNTLFFLISDFGVLPLPNIAMGIVITIIGLILIGVGVGLWRLRFWGWALGLVVSSFLIAIAVLALDFTSFTFIRGIIVVIYLLAVRRHFQRHRKKAEAHQISNNNDSRMKK